MSVMSKVLKEQHSELGSKLRDFILGWQDGLVNVLGLVLGVASATQDTRLVLISGLAAAFAEAISMSAVAYTSTRAEVDFYNSELARERKEVREVPDMERKEVRDIFWKKGFRGKLLDAVVKKITSNKKAWIQTMMEEELKLSPVHDNPKDAALVVLAASFVAPMIALIPFMLLPVTTAIVYSLVISLIVLFVMGSVEARLTIGDWKKRGMEMAAVGMAAAILGYVVGKILGAAI